MEETRIELTSDGSHSIFSEKFQALYHSKHGAIQESLHIFINSGLRYIKDNLKKLHILEMGFGTGLNLLLTLISSEDQTDLKISYDAVEAYPISVSQAAKLNYLDLLNRQDLIESFYNVHNSDWDKEHCINELFSYRKLNSKIEEITFDKKYDLVYYDAFAPLIQEELWTQDIFTQISNSLNKNAVLVSYCAKGSFKRALIATGFEIEKVPGPPGKREMIRATYIG